MPIDFRCTRCRARLHVPTRWGGTTVPCPKCETRVFVPQSAERRPQTSLESRSAEASIAALASSPIPGGVFAADDFALPDPSSEPLSEPAHVAVKTAGVTLPRWAVYAGLAFAVALLLGSFLLGFWYGSGYRGTTDRPAESHDVSTRSVLPLVRCDCRHGVTDRGSFPAVRRIERFAAARRGAVGGHAPVHQART